MGETGASSVIGEGGVERTRLGRLAGLAGLAGAVLIALGLMMMPALPGSEVSAPEVYTFFLDESSALARPAALVGVGLVLASMMFAALRTLVGRRRGPATAGGVMLALIQIGVGLQAVALGMISVLALRPEDADPATSRALLDLSEWLAGISGAAFALGLVAAALAIRRAAAPLPKRFSEAALFAAIGPALWCVRLFSDSGTFEADSFLGSSLGWILLTAWILAAGVWLLARGTPTPPPEPHARTAPAAAPRQPKPEPRPRRVTRFQTRPRPEHPQQLTPRPKRPGAGQRRPFRPPPPLDPVRPRPTAPVIPPRPDPVVPPEPEPDVELKPPSAPQPETEDEFFFGAGPPEESEPEPGAEPEPEPAPEGDDEPPAEADDDESAQ